MPCSTIEARVDATQVLNISDVWKVILRIAREAKLFLSVPPHALKTGACAILYS